MHEQPPALDAAAALAYEQLLVPGLFAPSAGQAMALAEIRPGESVLDLACGTGIAARLAAPLVGRAGRVVGVDSDQGMLSVARGIDCGEGAAHLEMVRADAIALPFGDGTFDLALCLQGLQFFANASQGLKELRRVLKPGGRLVATTWGPIDRMPGHVATYAALEAHGIATASPRRGFRLDTPRLLVELLRTAGFRDAHAGQMQAELVFPSAQAFVDGMLRGAPYTRRALESLPQAVRDSCRRVACGNLARFESARGGLALPACVNLIRARC